MKNTKKKKKLTKQGKIIFGLGGVVLMALLLLVGTILFGGNDKKENKPTPPISGEVTPTHDSGNPLADKYNPIWEEYSDLNEDYIAYLEWENDLLYNYGDDTTDPYPHLIVRSRIVDDKQGDVNIANSEYMRNDIAHDDRSFGQDFMDGDNAVDENYVPTDQNIIIYGHYVYPEKYGVDFLKFTPLHKLKDRSVYDTYDTFTLTFNHQQRTYQIAHVFNYEKSWFKDRQDSPVATNYSEQELATYMEKIETTYNDFLDTGIEIGPDDNFVTLQTCVENDENTLFFVVAKEIDRVNF